MRDGVTMMCGEDARAEPMTARPGSPCFHCGEPIPAGVAFAARIHAREEPVCCHGCKAVAEFISGAGLDDYYKYRDGAARAPTSRRVQTAGPPTTGPISSNA